MHIDALIRVPQPQNEPVRAYAPGDPARDSLKHALKKMAGERIEIPCFIGGAEIKTGKLRKVVMPHSHHEVVAEFHLAGPEELRAAADSALSAKADWEALPWHERAGVFLRAAELLAGPWRDRLNAATMLGQSKNVHQAEIDAACELIDFLRFNAWYYQRIIEEQPLSTGGVWNRLDHRPLEGFVAAITPFNFTAIAANLPAAPAMLGNTVVWKPSDTQMLAAYHTMRLFQAAGLPPGVINLVGADGPEVSSALLSRPELAGVHFTGSTATFRGIWKTVGERIGSYRTYPRLVGETGGKDFVFAHESADPEVLVAALVRGAFEYQGQKCSAASRAYIPAGLWRRVEEKLVSETRSLKMGDVRNFKNFVNAVIDERAYRKITAYLEKAKAGAKILAGGSASAETGYFVEPTVVRAPDPRFITMEEEIFGPVLSVYVYDESRLADALHACDTTSQYALTGALIGQDRAALLKMADRLRHAAGNLYLNDKPTGAVVGQQPFGGGRASGTNDKAGSALNLLRWVSPRTIKEMLSPVRDYRYPWHHTD